MVKVYIASPYTIGDKEENVRVQIDAAQELMDMGFAPFVPLLSHYQHMAHPRSWESWMEQDFEWIRQCDVLLRLPGESKGADLEVAFARGAKIPVVHSIETLQRGFWPKFSLTNSLQSGITDGKDIPR